jgi:hypothetical protein
MLSAQNIQKINIYIYVTVAAAAAKPHGLHR